MRPVLLVVSSTIRSTITTNPVESTLGDQRIMSLA